MARRCIAGDWDKCGEVVEVAVGVAEVAEVAVEVVAVPEDIGVGCHRSIEDTIGFRVEQAEERREAVAAAVDRNC